MKISVKAKPRAHEDKVEKLEDGSFQVWVKAPPVKGLANMAIISALADYFKVSRSQVRLVSGYSSQNKIFEIET